MDDQFDSKGGEQNIAQGDHAIGKQVNNYGIPPELFAQYVRDLGVTDSALASFFKILEEQRVSHGGLDSGLREIALRHKELLLRFEAVTSDDPQVQALKDQAGQAIKDGDYDRADELLNQAKKRDRAAVATLKANISEQQAALEARQLSEAVSWMEQADLQRLQYRYEESAQYFKEAAAALPEERKQERAIFLSAAGYDLNNIACYAAALSLYEQSLFIRREIGDRKGEATSLNNISQIYDAQGEHGKALEYLEQSLAINREIGDTKGESATLSNIATIYLAKGDYPNALKNLEQSLVLARDMHDRESEARALNNISEIHRQQGDYATALQYVNQALAIAREIKDKSMESKCLNNISVVYCAQKNYDAALEHSEQSLAIRQIGDHKGESTTINNIASIYCAKKDYPAALKQYEQALAIAKAIGAKAEQAGISGNIGLLYKKQGELAKAEPYLSRAVELMEQLEHPMLKNARKALEEVRAKLRGQD